MVKIYLNLHVYMLNQSKGSTCDTFIVASLRWVTMKVVLCVPCRQKFDVAQ